MNEREQEQGELLCPSGTGPEAEGRHEWAAVRSGDEVYYKCDACCLEVPAAVTPLVNELGRVLRSPATGAEIVEVEPANEAFASYRSAMNGAW